MLDVWQGSEYTRGSVILVSSSLQRYFYVIPKFTFLCLLKNVFFGGFLQRFYVTALPLMQVKVVTITFE